MEWCLDARVLGSLPLHALGSLGLLPFSQYPRWIESTFWSRMVVGPRSLWVASQRSESSPCSKRRFWGRRPFARSTIARWQEATEPQSPEGGGQRACHTEGAHPMASGRRKEVVLFRQTYPALTNGGVDNAVVPCGP